MKQLFLLLAIAVATLGATAQQKRFSTGPYLAGALPVGAMHDSHKTGYGGGIQAHTIPGCNGGATASFSPGVGVRFGMPDVAARYEVWTMHTTPSFLSLKAAVRF